MGYFEGDINGKYRSRTISAVRYFQAANGLQVTGITDCNTLSAINNSFAQTSQGIYPSVPSVLTSSISAVGQTIPPGGVLQLGDSSPKIMVLQQRLAYLKLYQGSLSGYFDDATRFAVIRFQQAYGIRPASGIVGKTTWNYLQQVGGSLAGLPTE